MKVVRAILGGLFVLCFLFVLLISSFEIASYSDYGWYQKEYEKYDVLTDLEMEMDDVMHVTKEMMAYLRGNREDLVVDTIVAGQKQEFFNDREKAHMKDVQELFVGGIYLRRIAIGVMIVSALLLFVMKAKWKRILAKSYLIGAGIFVIAVAVLGVLISRDFNSYFTLFHKIFFTNDLWLLDWNTDLLIRMLPEGFFFDMALRIGVLFVVSIVIFVILSVVVLRKSKKNKKNL